MFETIKKCMLYLDPKKCLSGGVVEFREDEQKKMCPPSDDGLCAACAHESPSHDAWPRQMGPSTDQMLDKVILPLCVSTVYMSTCMEIAMRWLINLISPLIYSICLFTCHRSMYLTWGRGWMTKASGVGERRKGRGELRRDCHHRVAALFLPTRMQQWYIDIWYITMIYMGEGAGGGPFAGKITWCPWGAPEYVLKQEDSSELTLAFVIMTIIANNDKM